jgi:hypothetical protein
MPIKKPMQSFRSPRQFSQVYLLQRLSERVEEAPDIRKRPAERHWR